MLENDKQKLIALLNKYMSLNVIEVNDPLDI